MEHWWSHWASKNGKEVNKPKKVQSTTRTGRAGSTSSSTTGEIQTFSWQNQARLCLPAPNVSLMLQQWRFRRCTRATGRGETSPIAQSSSRSYGTHHLLQLILSIRTVKILCVKKFRVFFLNCSVLGSGGRHWTLHRWSTARYHSSMAKSPKPRRRGGQEQEQEQPRYWIFYNLFTVVHRQSKNALQMPAVSHRNCSWWCNYLWSD